MHLLARKTAPDGLLALTGMVAMRTVEHVLNGAHGAPYKLKYIFSKPRAKKSESRVWVARDFLVLE
jgi:hypothetical protein